MYFSVQSAQGLYIRLCLILRLPIPATPIHLAHRDNPEVRTEGIVTAAYNVFLTEGDYGGRMYDSDGGVSASSER